MIVVDIQGVGDLWTDPQIHTADGSDYGDGNLGTRGMALFFHSHVCNGICESLRLSKFDLASSESAQHKKFLKMQVGGTTCCVFDRAAWFCLRIFVWFVPICTDKVAPIVLVYIFYQVLIFLCAVVAWIMTFTN